MAKPIALNRNVPPAMRIPRQVPELEPQDVEFFHPPKGMDTLSPDSRIDRSHSPALLNLVLQKGVLRSRYALSKYGSKPAAPAEQTWLVSDVEGIGVSGGQAVRARYPLRWTTSRLWVFSGGDWVDTGVANHKIDTDGVDFTTWRSAVGAPLVVYSTGITAAAPGLIEYTPVNGANRLLAGSPVAKHVATFGNRIVATVYDTTTIKSTRLQWCVKNNDNDWAGLGSGFEDLLTPVNDIYDEAMGVYPISDTTALVVREASIWRMDLTGFFDAPFTFTLLTDQLGTTARRTIRAITGGVIFLGYDDVYIVTLGGVQRIGLPGLARAFIDPTFSALGSAGVASTLVMSYGYFDHFNRRYFLNIKNLGTYVYSFDDQGWTRQLYSFEPFSIAQTYYQSGSGEFHGVYVTADSASAMFTLREDPAKTADDDPSGTVGISTTFEAWTGEVHVDEPGGRRAADATVGGSPLYKTELVEMQLEYEAGISQTLFFDYFINGVWVQFSTLAVTATSGIDVVSVRKDVSGARLKARVRSDTLGQIKIYSLHVFAKKGGRIHP